MNVFVVTCEQAYAHSFSVHAVFSTEQLAQAYINQCFVAADLCIEEFNVDSAKPN